MQLQWGLHSFTDPSANLPLQISATWFVERVLITGAAAEGVSRPSHRPAEGPGRGATKGNDQDRLNFSQVPLLTAV